jgi:hypothetical protein
MAIWLDGFSALIARLGVVFAILILILWGTILIRGALEKIFHNRLTDDEYLALSLAGWIIPALIWAGLYLGLFLLFGNPLGLVLSILAALSALFFLRSGMSRFSPSGVVLILFLAMSIVLRMAFVRETLLPSYFDSAEHYRIIQSLVGAVPTWITPAYYHIGYHTINAAIITAFQLRLEDVMLVFGQIVLAVLPVSLFFIVRRETHSASAAWFAVLLAGFGWHMPSHAVNWGKYPALFSLVCIHFALSLAYLYRNGFKEYRKTHLSFFALAVGVSALIHTRSLIVYGLVALAFGITWWWGYRSPIVQRISFGALVLILAFEIYLLTPNPALALLVDSYLRNDVWMLVFLLLLLPFAILSYSRFVFLILVAVAIALAALFIPFRLSVYGVLTPLDRPYVQMLAYLPFSIIGGLGLAGLIQWTRRLFLNPNLPARIAVFLAFGLLLIHTSLNYKFYPSDCCQLAGRDDLAALDWIADTLPPDANILIASSAFHVTSFETEAAQAGSDAGIWISVLTSREVRLMPYHTRFQQADVWQWVCSQNVDYIYVGGMPQSFDIAQLSSQPNWYQEAFALLGAKIYRVTGCK